MAFECTLMEDPVVASDGHTYNRKHIQDWLDSHTTSPLTGEPLDHKMLVPNLFVRRLVIAWLEEHSLPVPAFAKPVKAQAAGAAAAGISTPPLLQAKKKCTNCGGRGQYEHVLPPQHFCNVYCRWESIVCTCGRGRRCCDCDFSTITCSRCEGSTFEP